MGNLISKSELMDGDILLYHGSRWISKAIRYFDGTEVNHASLFFLENDVIEAVASGVVKRDLDSSINQSAPVIVKRLINRPKDMIPVINKANSYVGNRYGYEQLLLLALICSVRKIRLNNFVSKFVSKVLETAASILLQYTNGNKKAIICSELVFRSYDEALGEYNDPYTIYLGRYKSENGMNTKLSNQFKSSSINSESLISHFYGINRLSFNANLIHSPYLEEKNLIRRGSSFSGGLNDDILEELFDGVISSYKNEDYQIDKEEYINLKNSLDLFIVANYHANSMNKTFAIPNNVNDILHSFIHDNANFVSPGDLYKANNLQLIGYLK